LEAQAVLITGPEEFLRRRAEARAIADFGLAHDDIVSLDEDTSHDLDIAQLLDELRTPGLFSSQKGVVIREAAHLLKEKPLAKFVEKELPHLANVLLVVNAAKPPAALLKAFKKSGQVREFKRLYATDYNTGVISAHTPFGRWLREEAHGKDLRLDDEAVVRIIEASGQDAAQALELLEALSLDAPEGAVTIEQVEGLAGIPPGDASRYLERAALRRDLHEAMDVIERGYRDGIYRFGRYTHSGGSIAAAFLDALVLSALKLYRVKCGGVTVADAGVFRQIQDLYRQALSRLSPKDAEELLEAAFRAEWLFKAGLARGRDALVWLSAFFCGCEVPDPGSFGEILTRR
jgi:DNA polymerase III delta subunit